MDFLGLINLSILVAGAQEHREDDRPQRSTSGRCRWRAIEDVRKTYELLDSGEYDGRVPVGVARRCAAMFRSCSRPRVARRRRDGRAYRPGPMAHIPRFVRCKHGMEKLEYPHPSLKRPARRDVRRHRLPGPGDADRSDHRRTIRSARPTSFAGRWARRKRRRWRSSAKTSSRAQRRTASPKRTPNNIFDLIEPFAGYALQQSARRLLRDGRLPDRLPEGELPRRIHGRPDGLLRRQIR